MRYTQGVDLNLLGPLAALLDERHVSRAAQRAAMTQPAMSRSLRKLRHVLGDELLVRTPRGYELTPRAERMQRQLAAILPRLETLFADQAFDPNTATEAFLLAGTDYPASVFGPAVVRSVLRQSPGSALRFEPWHGGVFNDLERGALDLAFYGVGPPAALRSEELLVDRFVCVLSAEHPLSDSTQLTLEGYLRCSHIIVGIIDGNQPVIDRRLQSLGTPRKASLTMPYHSAALLAVPGTMLVATVPWQLIAHYPDDPAIRVVAAPPEIEFMHYQMVWHPRLDDDPAQRWLRDTVRSAAAAL